MHVGARRLGSVGLPALYWNFIPLPTGAATRAKGSSTVGASLFLLVVLSSKIWAFGGCYGAVRDAESNVGAALRQDGGASAYEGTGVGVRGRARRWSFWLLLAVRSRSVISRGYSWVGALGNAARCV